MTLTEASAWLLGGLLALTPLAIATRRLVFLSRVLPTHPAALARLLPRDAVTVRIRIAALRGSLAGDPLRPLVDALDLHPGPVQEGEINDALADLAASLRLGAAARASFVRVYVFGGLLLCSLVLLSGRDLGGSLTGSALPLAALVASCGLAYARVDRAAKAIVSELRRGVDTLVNEAIHGESTRSFERLPPSTAKRSARSRSRQ